MLLANKFVYIHIPKTAGTSIQKALVPFVNKKERGIRKHRDLGYTDHVRASHVKETNKRFTFTFVRNPWEWAQSLYHYSIQYGTGRSWGTQIRRYKKMGLGRWVDGELETWIRANTKWHSPNNIYQQSTWISPNVDFVGKFENLQADFKYVCDHLGLKATLPHDMKSKHPHYSVEYTPEAIAKIEELFPKDIAKYKYKFETL